MFIQEALGSQKYTRCLLLKTERIKVFKQLGIQNRHVMGDVLFLKETKKSIHTVDNAQAVRAIKQKESRALPILYETWFEKRQNIWKI